MSDGHVLLVENDAARLLHIATALGKLRERRYQLVSAPTLEAGLQELARAKFAAVLLNLKLPDALGLPAFLRLQSRAGTVPIVVLVDAAEEEMGAEAVRRGALDYLLIDEISSSLLDKTLRLALERTHTILALRASEARYRTLFESTAAGVYQATTDDRLISANPAFINMLGYSREDEVLCLDMASDIFAHPEQHLEMRRELEEQGEIRSRETTVRHRSGERLTVLHSARLIRDSRNRPLYYEGTIADITDAHKRAQQLSHDASHDALTGLLNRREFERRLQSAHQKAAIDSSTLALIMLDLDGFKHINDRFGHTAGDDALRHVASVLKRSARANDAIARLGGDEFVLLLENCGLNDAHRIAESIVARLGAEDFLWAGQTLKMRASVGVAVGRDDPAWITILERADMASYDAKAAGGNCVRVFHEDATSNVRLGRIRQIAMRLEQALSENELELHVARIAPLQNPRGASHYEFSTRFADPEMRDVQPEAIAEVLETHPALAHRLDEWTIRATLQRLAREPNAASAGRCFMNLSGATCEDSDFPRFLAAQAREAGVPVQRIGFQIDDRTLDRRFAPINTIMQRLVAHQVEFALDRFSISSFAHLKSLPFTYAKLDHRRLIDGPADEASDALVRSLHQVTHALKRRTIVRSVDTRDLLRDLTSAGIDYAQGRAIAA